LIQQKAITVKSWAVLLLMVLSLFSLDVLASDTDSVMRYTKFNVGYYRGFVYPHHQYLQFHNNEYINGIDFRVGKTFPTINRRRIPTIGLGGYASNLGNSSLYGNLYSAHIYFSSPYLTRKNFSFGSNISSGLGWITKPNHPSKNPMNQAIGSHFNAFIVLAFDFQYCVNSSFSLFLSPSFIHNSNGKMKLPNTGLNIFSLRFGVGYDIKDDVIVVSENLYIKNNLKRHRLNLLVSGGIKEESKQKPIQKGVGGLNTNYSYFLGKNGRVGGGFDVFYIPVTDKNETEFETGVKSDPWSGGAYLGYEIVWERLSFVLQQGIRLFYHNTYESDYYSRLGIRFRFAQNYVANCSLKTSRLTAEYIEWGIGYDFNF